jgi:hypothetical protein
MKFPRFLYSNLAPLEIAKFELFLPQFPFASKLRPTPDFKIVTNHQDVLRILVRFTLLHPRIVVRSARSLNPQRPLRRRVDGYDVGPEAILQLLRKRVALLYNLSNPTALAQILKTS